MDFQIENMLKSVGGKDVSPLSPPFLSSPVLFPRSSTCRTSGMASSHGVKITLLAGSFCPNGQDPVPDCAGSPSLFPCKSLKFVLRTCVPKVGAEIVPNKF